MLLQNCNKFLVLHDLKKSIKDVMPFKDQAAIYIHYRVNKATIGISKVPAVFYIFFLNLLFICIDKNITSKMLKVHSFYDL